jgi:hypothetical protein
VNDFVYGTCPVCKQELVTIAMEARHVTAAFGDSTAMCLVLVEHDRRAERCPGSGIVGRLVDGRWESFTTWVQI